VAGLDIVIRGGRIATADAVVEADIGIAGETVAVIGHDLHGDRDIDATGMLVLPGGVDAHVHLSLPPGEGAGGPHWVDDFTSGSAAALAGGITTLGNMAFPAPGETPRATLEREGRLARAQAIADVFLHPVLGDLTPDALDDIPRLRATGCASIKIFLVAHDFDRQGTAVLDAVRRAGAAGLLTLLHCEDHAIIADAMARLLAAGRGDPRYYGEACPVVSEVVATQRAVAIAEATGAPVYIVHLSSARALAVCAEAQARGLPVYVETRPLYLHLTQERLAEPDGPKYIGQPPLRTRADVDALWAGLRAGAIHTVCSDHAPWSLAAKLDPALTVADPRPGVENLQTLRPMLYSEGVRAGRLSLERFVALTATNAARLMGLYPRKGTIAVGSDADLVIFDPERTRTIDAAMLKSRADYSVYEGWEVTGWPLMTLSRGEVVFRDDEIVGQPGRGLTLERGAMQFL